MDLEGIVLSEISDRERQIQYTIYMGNLKIYNKLMNKQNSRLTDVENKLVVTNE